MDSDTPDSPGHSESLGLFAAHRRWFVDPFRMVLSWSPGYFLSMA